jgi:hypothetical protein
MEAPPLGSMSISAKAPKCRNFGFPRAAWWGYEIMRRSKLSLFRSFFKRFELKDCHRQARVERWIQDAQAKLKDEEP